MASVDFTDKVAVVFGDEGAGVGGGAQETVMTDNQAVSAGCCSKRQGSEGNRNVEMHFLP